MREKKIEQELVTAVKKAWRDLSEVCISRFRWNARPFTAFTAWQVCLCGSQSTKSETKTSTAFKTQTSEAVRLQGLRP